MVAKSAKAASFQFGNFWLQLESQCQEGWATLRDNPDVENGAKLSKFGKVMDKSRIVNHEWCVRNHQQKFRNFTARW